MSRDSRYALPPHSSHRRIRSPWVNVLALAGWMAGAFVLTILAAIAIRRCLPERRVDGSPSPPQPELALPASAFQTLVFPTTANLLATATGEQERVFMPTASGRPESAFFGSTRTGADGRARFHSGVDIAPARRDRRGAPLDTVVAIAKGRVAYINRRGGGSSYGLYLVLLHEDPAGPIYSLYAHLASVAEGLRPGVRVAAGTPLGVLGHSASTGIPQARAHLHLEIGVLLSERFGAWARARKIRPDRGNYHGWNLFAVDPLAVYAQQRRTAAFTMQSFLERRPPAFELVIEAAKPLDFFARYPALWNGPGVSKGILTLRVSEGGVILSGRPASPAEEESFRLRRAPCVLNVDETALGRNGMHLIARERGLWTLGRGASRWIEVLTH